MNQLQLSASLVEREQVRYTPAGIPIVAAKLMHSANVTEAGMPRQVEFEMPAVAAGTVSQELERVEFGANHLFTGFLAKRNRNSRTLVFHVTGIE